MLLLLCPCAKCGVTSVVCKFECFVFLFNEDIKNGILFPYLKHCTHVYIFYYIKLNVKIPLFIRFCDSMENNKQNTIRWPKL